MVIASCAPQWEMRRAMPPRSSLTSSFSVTDSNNEVVCPLRNQDGSSCRKRCLGVSCLLLHMNHSSLLLILPPYLAGSLHVLGGGRLSLPSPLPFGLFHQNRDVLWIGTEAYPINRKSGFVPCRNISVEHTLRITFPSSQQQKRALRSWSTRLRPRGRRRAKRLGRRN